VNVPERSLFCAFWLCQMATAAAVLGVALYYQYALGEEPCQICVQVRLWVVALFLLGALGAVLQHRLIRVSLLLVTLASVIGLGERSHVLYQLEQGVGSSSCEFQLGMPSWFAVDQWFPAIFEVRNLCSFTPAMPWGLTMAESLVLSAFTAGLITLIALGFTVRGLAFRTVAP